MNRNIFRNISVVVVASLALLAAVQCFYVWRLWRDAVADFGRRMESAAYKSVYKAFGTEEESDVVNVDLSDFELYFSAALLELDVLQPHDAEVFDRSDGDRVLMRRPSDVPLRDPMTVEVEIDDKGLLLLRVQVDVPYGRFFGRMWGVMASAAGIVLLLAGAFAYMLRTMFRQRSLAQMRRDLTHNITHELKTPIAVAYAACDALRNFGADADASRRSRYVDMVASQLSSLSSMVERILAVSVAEEEPQRLSLSRFGLRPVLDAVAAGFAVSGGKRAEIGVDCAADLTVRADRFHLSNVVATLVDNAVKYSGDSVAVSIAARRTAEGVEISVADNGAGMDARHIKHIFDKFYRIPTGEVQSVRGYGLGLYYARQVAERHGGRIAARSRKGAGTTITVTIPDDGR